MPDQKFLVAKSYLLKSMEPYSDVYVSVDMTKSERIKHKQLRRVHTMKVMRIGGELIQIVCVHTECALTAIRIECAFGQSTSIGGLKPV